MEELKEYVYVYKSSVYEDFKEKGQELSPHDSDKDTPYFSLALKLECGIWSNEPGFKKQSKVRIFNTRDLRELLDKDF
jgi:predicted nucleic acid-binding protein